MKSQTRNTPQLALNERDLDVHFLTLFTQVYCLHDVLFEIY